MLESIDTAELLIQRMKQEVDDEYWGIVAKVLKSLQPDTRFSRNACEARFAALTSENDNIPPELDDERLQRAASLERQKKQREIQMAKEEADRAAAEANKKTQVLMQAEKFIIYRGKKLLQSTQIPSADETPQQPSLVVPNNRPPQKRKLSSNLEHDNTAKTNATKRRRTNAEPLTSQMPKSHSLDCQSKAPIPPKSPSSSISLGLLMHQSQLMLFPRVSRLRSRKKR